ncbi:hypothetical protein [Mycolicibacterium fallax]|uniref:Uncharacterized protein n=1 Tax=Mycolicibacterium fallax TaxID=1793 RepID=A0A1X1RKY1_MYCFA|nr:hypothetical protein [Mycolicibacterium fallax]ORV08473.1 hypothetical protein AWC04_01985 [Mycolicibacterium fallax]BBZ00251.1 hypothetical protein MFAL_37170 [Mycolicibacterium fallax]HSA40491.1 hypothetical protein [Mycobacterium sp.]
MNLRGKSALFAAGLVVISLISAPTAAARPTCHEAGGATRCETNGSVSIKAVPQTRAPSAGQLMMPGMGRRGLMWGW